MDKALEMRREVTILEDDSDIREICAYLFLMEGYTVNTYTNISELRKSKKTPDLYLLYVMLPDGNGLDMCNELKAAPATAKVPIIIMSAHIDVYDFKGSCKAEDFISKPFNLEKLATIAAQLIENAGLDN